MACPHIAGQAAIVRDYLAQGYYPTGLPNSNDKIPNPSAMLVRALIINSARPLKRTEMKLHSGASAYYVDDTKNTKTYLNLGVVPSMLQGHGLATLSTTLPFQNNGKLNLGLSLWDRVQIKHGETIAFVPGFTCPSAFSLRVTLAFNDVAGGSTGDVVSVVDDIDLVVTQGARRWYPNARSGPDSMNNIEKVIAPCNGQAFGIFVTGKKVTKGPQKVALVATMADRHPKAQCSSDVCDEPHTKGTKSQMDMWVRNGFKLKKKYGRMSGSQEPPSHSCHWMDKAKCMAKGATNCGWCHMPESNCHSSPCETSGRCWDVKDNTGAKKSRLKAYCELGGGVWDNGNAVPVPAPPAATSTKTAVKLGTINTIPPGNPVPAPTPVPPMPTPTPTPPPTPTPTPKQAPAPTNTPTPTAASRVWDVLFSVSLKGVTHSQFDAVTKQAFKKAVAAHTALPQCGDCWKRVDIATSTTAAVRRVTPVPTLSVSFTVTTAATNQAQANLVQSSLSKYIQDPSANGFLAHFKALLAALNKQATFPVSSSTVLAASTKQGAPPPAPPPAPPGEDATSSQAAIIGVCVPLMIFSICACVLAAWWFKEHDKQDVPHKKYEDEVEVELDDGQSSPPIKPYPARNVHPDVVEATEKPVRAAKPTTGAASPPATGTCQERWQDMSYMQLKKWLKGQGCPASELNAAGGLNQLRLLAPKYAS